MLMCGTWMLGSEHAETTGKDFVLKSLFVISIKKVSGLTDNFNSKVLMVKDQGQALCRWTFLLLWLMFYLGNSPSCLWEWNAESRLCQARLPELSVTLGNSFPVWFLSSEPSASRETGPYPFHYHGCWKIMAVLLLGHSSSLGLFECA